MSTLFLTPREFVRKYDAGVLPKCLISKESVNAARQVLKIVHTEKTNKYIVYTAYVAVAIALGNGLYNLFWNDRLYGTRATIISVICFIAIALLNRFLIYKSSRERSRCLTFVTSTTGYLGVLADSLNISLENLANLSLAEISTQCHKVLTTIGKQIIAINEDTLKIPADEEHFLRKRFEHTFQAASFFKLIEEQTQTFFLSRLARRLAQK